MLDFFTPARSIAEVANKPTAGNIIDAAADTAATAAGLKALAAPTKVAQKVNRTIPTPPGGSDMSKFKVAKSLFGKAVDALKGDGKNKFSPSGASASNRTPTPPKPKTPKTPKTATSPTSAPMPKKPVTPKVNKPKTPPKTPKAETPKKLD